MIRIDLLHYLVTAQLTARVRDGHWMSAERLVGATHAWLACHHAECGWLDRLRIGAASVTIAREIYELAAPDAHGSLAGESAQENSRRKDAMRARCAAVLQRLMAG